MPASVVPSFLLYCFIGGISPGPANFCSLSAALRYGWRPALRQWRGIFVGFFVISMISVVVIYTLGTLLNDYVHWLSWIGAAYLLWMAWNTLRSSGSKKGDIDPAQPTFRNGLLVQLTNVKVMIFCLTALSGFVLPYSRSFLSLLAVGLVLPFGGPSCNLIWLFAGASLQKAFENHRKLLDVATALMLVVCAVNMVWH